MASFGEILAEFKGAEQDCIENVSPLVDDALLRNGITAWKSVAIRYSKTEQCECKDNTSKWNWLWTQIEYDQGMFGIVAGTKPTDVTTLITRLIGLRLIYPDGTINSYARNYLQALIMAKLGGKKKSPGRPKKEETKQEEK